MNHELPPRPTPTSTEVTVIGAGMLGLFNALQYAKRGIHVVLIDNLVGKKRSYKVGESLLIFTNPFLRTIGELDDFLGNSFPKDGVWFTYGTENAENFEDSTEWGFQTKLPQRWYDAMENKKLFRSMFYDAQIVRPEAEDLMLEAARAHPLIQLLDTALVKDVVIKDADLHEVLWECQQTHASGTLLSHWVIDCGGRRRLLAKKYGHDVADVKDDFKTTAVWGQFDHFSDDLFDQRWAYQYREKGTTLRDRNTLHFWGDGYWMWLIRLAGERVSVNL